MTISLDLGKNCYLLCGKLDRIKSNNANKLRFKAIKADFSQDEQITIPFSTDKNPNNFDTAEEQYKLICELLDKLGIEYELTEAVINFTHEINSENENFIEFSKKAKDIRNANLVGDNLKNFTSVVTNKLTRGLYPRQFLSSYHLAFAQNACNFSVPGSGKTAIVYGAYAYLKSLMPTDHKHVDRILIISPLSAFLPWEQEYKECFSKDTSIVPLVDVSPDQRKKHFYSDSYTEITLISYQSASNSSTKKAIVDFLKRNNVMLVLDEAHRIKNTDDGLWARTILSFAKYAKSRIALTGTPAPNSYKDLHNLYKFIWPSKDIIGFPINYLEQLNSAYKPSAKKDIEQLVNNISPFFIRIKKADLNLPEPIMHPQINVPMNKNQRIIYDYIEKKYIDSVKDENSIDLKQKLKQAKLIRLMQCATNPGLLNKPLNEHLSEVDTFSKMSAADQNIMQLIQSEDETPSKFKKILELVKQITGKVGADGKVIIWSYFVQTLYDLKKYLHDNKIISELLYGATPVEKSQINIPTRKEIIDRFHHNDCPYKVLIANPQAVGESISLHKACHNAIYLEKNFNAATYMQSKDRIHRYGLDDNEIINYYNLISEDSIDQVIHDRVLEKEQAMLGIIESEEIPLLNLDIEINVEDGETSSATDFVDVADIQAIISYYHAKSKRQNTVSSSL